MHIILHQPEIPANTGNIGRTCVATGTDLHLIEPLGFRLTEKEIKRAGMDYWEHLNVTRYMNFDEFKTELSNSNNIYLIAEFKNEIVGICFSQIKEISNNKIMKDRKILHIENICVDENHQKKELVKNYISKLYN